MLNCQSGMGRLYQVTVNRKLKISLGDLFSATSCHLFFFFFCWLLGVSCPLGTRHRVMGCEEGFQYGLDRIVNSGILSTSLLVFCCFDVLVDSVVVNSL